MGGREEVRGGRRTDEGNEERRDKGREREREGGRDVNGYTRPWSCCSHRGVGGSL